MAFTGSPVNSVQRALELANKSEPRDSSALHTKYANYTHTAGAGTGEINMLTLPAGRIRIYPDLCRYTCADMAASADLHIGHRAYVNEAGTTVDADDNEWLDNVDSGGGAKDAVIGDGGTTLNQYESRDGIIVYMMVDSGNIEDTDTLTLCMVFSYV